MRSVRSLLAGIAPLLALLAGPTGAPAATTCDFGGGLLEVRLPADGDTAGLFVGEGQILVFHESTQVACAGGGGPPTVSNVNVISVVNAPGGVDNAVGILGPSQFAPGANTVEGENGGTPEIEISVNLNDGPGSALWLEEAYGVPIRFGDSGINPNAIPGEIQPDADIFPTNVSQLTGTGSYMPTTLSADGGAGTGGPLTDAITLEGGYEGDVLIGGAGPDSLDGHEGSDTILGKGGNDFLDVDAGTVDNESLDGGAGTDEVFIEGQAGVTIDLAITGPQNTGGTGSLTLTGIENLFGTDFADVLRGDGEANRLRGGDGDDVLEGRGGFDALEGGEGADLLLARDGEADSADCGPNLDTVTTDAAGVDAVVDCDSVFFPPIPGPDPPGGGGGGGGGGTPAVTPGRCAGKKATITGTNAGETIRGTRRRDVIDARGGNDRVEALAGDDIVCGGTGRDRLDGGKGRDTLAGGIGSDKLSGSRGNDRLLGGAGRDELVGGSGRDRLLGGAGKDAQRP